MEELIGKLTRELGIGESQARGGTGLVFKLLKEKLSGSDFGGLTDALGNPDELIREAPDSGLGGLLGGLASKLGGDDLGNLAELAGGFSKLDLDADKISGFVGILTDFVKDKGGENLLQILRKVL